MLWDEESFVGNHGTLSVLQCCAHTYPRTQRDCMGGDDPGPVQPNGDMARRLPRVHPRTIGLCSSQDHPLRPSDPTKRNARGRGGGFRMIEWPTR